MAFINVYHSEEDSKNVACAGAIVTQIHVLTLATCVYAAQKSPSVYYVTVTVGIDSRNGRSKRTYHTEYIDIPGHFDPSNYIDSLDIAVIMVNSYTKNKFI